MNITRNSTGTAGRLNQADDALLRALMSRSVTTYGCEGQVNCAGVRAPSSVWRASVDPIFGYPLGL